MRNKTEITTLCAIIGPITTGKTFTLQYDATKYNIIFIQLWASIGSGSRKFCALDTQMSSDIGNENRYIEGSIYYSATYNACVGISLSNDKTMTIKETSCNGYTSLYGGVVYGIKIKS